MTETTEPVQPEPDADARARLQQDERHLTMVQSTGCLHPALYGDAGQQGTAQGWCSRCRFTAAKAVEAGEDHTLIWGCPEPAEAKAEREAVETENVAATAFLARVWAMIEAWDETELVVFSMLNLLDGDVDGWSPTDLPWGEMHERFYPTGAWLKEQPEFLAEVAGLTAMRELILPNEDTTS